MGGSGTMMQAWKKASRTRSMDRTDGLKLIWPDRWVHVQGVEHRAAAAIFSGGEVGRCDASALC